jgi:predicted XRE-type DNA-binding protein
VTRGRVGVPSSGNVYLDLGFSPAEAAHLLLRSRLMVELESLIRRRRLTQCAAARLLGVSQPRVSDLVRGRIERFSLDALVELLAKAGMTVELVVRRDRHHGTGGSDQ